MRIGLVRTLAAGALLAFAAVGVASAGNTETIESEIKLRNNAPAFHGRIVSNNDACEQGRSVKLFKERRSGAKKLLGKTASDLEGKWQVLVDPLKSGAYFAVAQRREEGTAGTIFVCERAKSRTVVVD
jgi:hypothetical protein